MLPSAEEELGRRLGNLLSREQLLAPQTQIKTFSTPRRLAVLVEGLRTCQPDTEELVIGPSWIVAFRDGTPTPAAQAFAKKLAIDLATIEKTTTPKGEYAAARIVRRGQPASQILAAALPKEILAIYWPKNMYWRSGKPERFVRPIRWVVALLDDTVVPLELAGIPAGNTSRGHRVLYGSQPVLIPSATSYAQALRQASVLVEPAERRQLIRKQLDAAARTLPGARWREDAALLETVVHLTEYPSVLLGSFEPEYLALPEEVLVTVMRDHQKYFALEDATGKLAPHFLAVLNTEVDAQGQAIIRHGNARVLRARFKDARFFWDLDQKTPLRDRLPALDQVTFQKELGSYLWKTEQNLAIVRRLEQIAANRGLSFDRSALFTAVELAKTDLTTELVKEFTELQGIIGGLYARTQGLGETVALAIYEQYTPASIEDPIPQSVEGQLLGLADRMQTITAMFRIGQIPSGSRDPFALRRAANGIVKILALSALPLTLTDLLDAAAAEGQLRTRLEEFLRERVAFYLKEVRGFAHDVTEAVLAAGADDIRDLLARAEALTEARGSADFLAVSAAFKRIKNILRQAEEKGFTVGSPVSAPLSAEAQQLAHRAAELAPEVARLRRASSYRQALTQIAQLRPAVDLFFDRVMVLDPDPQLRSAHLGLIDQLLRSFSTIADFSEIAPPPGSN